MKISKAFDYLKTGNFALVAVTRRCNCRCAFCSLWKEKADIDAKRFIGSLDKMHDAGFRLIEFTGGEPTLLRELPEMIKETAARGMFVQMMTNGTMLTDEMCNKISDANLINISVDHYDNKVASSYRKFPKINERIKEGVVNLKKLGIAACSTTLLTKHNCKDIRKLIEFVNNELGIFFSFCPPEAAHLYPLDSSSVGIMPTKEELIGAMEEILHMKKEGYSIVNTKAFINDSIKWFKKEKVSYLCKGGKNIVYIDWNNNVYPCFRKDRICAIEEISKDKLRDLKCNECSFQCFREPSIFYTRKGKLSFMHDIKTLLPFAKSTRMAR